MRSLCLWLWASSFFDLVPGELLAPLPNTLAQLVLGALGTDLLDLVPGKLIPSPPTLVQLVL